MAIDDKVYEKECKEKGIKPEEEQEEYKTIPITNTEERKFYWMLTDEKKPLYRELFRIYRNKHAYRLDLKLRVLSSKMNLTHMPLLKNDDEKKKYLYDLQEKFLFETEMSLYNNKDAEQYKLKV